MNYRLVSDKVRANAVEAVRNAPDGSIITISEPTRSKEQSSKMWALIGDVMRTKPEGRQWAKETWRAAFMHSLGHQIAFAEGLDNSGPFPIGFHSSNLNVKQMRDMIDVIYAYGNEHQVQWTETIKGGWFDE